MTTSPRQTFRQAYMAYAGITEAQMPTHRLGARLAVLLLAVAGAIGVYAIAVGGWTWGAAAAIAAVIVWGLPAIGVFLLVVLGLVALAVWG